VICLIVMSTWMALLVGYAVVLTRDAADANSASRAVNPSG
jgi:hypothetical protein